MEIGLPWICTTHHNVNVVLISEHMNKDETYDSTTYGMIKLKINYSVYRSSKNMIMYWKKIDSNKNHGNT